MAEASARGIRRIGPPVAFQKVREGVYHLQVPLSAAPSADWRRLFYEAQSEVPPDFPPRSIEITGPLLRFRSDADSVAAKIALIDRWIERANQKEAALVARSEESRQRHQALIREQAELAELNARWAHL